MWTCLDGTFVCADAVLDRVRHCGRPAEIDLALGDVGDELAQVRRREQMAAFVGRVIAGDDLQPEAARRGERLELVAEDDVAFAQDAVDDDEVAVHVLEQGTDRGDADAAADQQRLRARARRVGEDTERSFGNDARSDRDLRDAAREVAEVLHGDPERAAVGSSRQGERMRPPPVAAREEPPEEELSRLRAQPVEPTPRHVERHDARAFRHDVGDAKAEAQRVERRLAEAEHDEHGKRRDVEAPPVVGGDRVEHELVAGRDLVEPTERDARVGGEMHEVPRLVSQPSAHDHDRARDDGDEAGRADRRRDHPGIDAAPDHRRDLLPEREVVHLRVAATEKTTCARMR